MTEVISHKQTFIKLKEDLTLQRERALQQILREINKKIYWITLNIQIYILKVLNQHDSMEQLKYTRLSYQILFHLFNLLFLQLLTITTILLST